MVSTGSLTPVPGAPIYGNTGNLDTTPVTTDTPQTDTPEVRFTGDVYTLLQYDQDTLSNVLGMKGALDFGWGKLSGEIEYAYPGLFPTDTTTGTVDGKSFTVKRINADSYVVSGEGLTETTISSADDIESLPLTADEKRLIRSLFNKVYVTSISPAGVFKGNLMFSTLEDTLRLRLGILPMPRPENDAGLMMLGIKQPDTNLGIDVSLGDPDFSVGLALMFSGVNPDDPYAAGIDNYKSMFSIGGNLKSLGLENFSLHNAITIGKFPEPGNAAGTTVVYSQEQLSLGYDFVDIFGVASHLTVGGTFGLEDYRYTNAQKLLNSIGGGLSVAGVIPLMRQEDRTVFGFDFLLRASYQYAEQFDDTASIVATSSDWNLQGAVGLTWAPLKDISIGLYLGGRGLFDASTREQPDIINGGTYTVNEDFNTSNFFAGLYVNYKLPQPQPAAPATANTNP